MTRVEHLSEDVVLYQGNCLDILPGLSADHVVSDPPFEAEAHTLQRRKLGKVVAGGREVLADSLPFAEITEDTRSQASRLITEACGGWCIAFCQAEAVQVWRECLESAGAKYKRAMVWIKPDGMPQFTGDRPGMGYESIVAAWCGAGRSRWNGGGRHGVFTCNKNDGPGPAPHPTTKPVRLMVDLVALFSDPAQTILDPFMGSGTTGVACVQLGRKFIGIELEPRYFEIAVKRISDELRRPRLQLEPVAKPVQEALSL